MIAAAVRTAAITVSQLLEMRLTRRPPSYTPAPLRTWSRQDWAVDVGHEGVLALTTALAYEAALPPATRRSRR